MSKIGTLSLFFALQLVTLGAVVASAAAEEMQAYRFVTNRGSGIHLGDGQLRLWEVSSDGSSLEVLDVISLGGVSGFPIHMDPFGRYLIQQHRIGDDISFNVFSVTASKELQFQAETELPGIFGGGENTLTEDGKYPVVECCDEAFETWYIQSLLVSGESELIEMPGRLQIAPPTAESPPNFFSPGLAGSAMLPGGDHLYLSTVRIEATAYFNSLRVHADGSIGGLEDQIVFNNAQPIHGGITTRSDQRLVCIGPVPGASVQSHAVSGDGTLLPVGRYEITDGPPTGANGLTFNPSGRSLLTAGGTLTPISRSGELDQPAIITVSDPTDEIGISPDGRLAAMELGSMEGGFGWGVFRVDPLGHSMELISVHIFPFAHSFIEFIPPRTEEVLGDANADARRDIADVITYLNHFNDDGTYPEWHPLSPIIRGPVPEARADANQDGEITEADLVWLIEFLLGR